MTSSPCPEGRLESLQIRVDLSSEEQSEIQRQLRSEFGPSVVDLIRTEEVNEMLARSDKGIEDCNSEVARLEKQIMDVQAEKQRLEEQRTKICALLSPIRKLPNETLLSILQCICQQNPNIITSDFTHFPTITIGSVCYRWRELALSSPSLWTNLHVEIDNNCNSPTFSNTVARCLERSGDCPLTLRLDLRGTAPIISLTQHAHRWKSFQCWGHRSLTDCSEISQLRFPLLIELQINNCFRDLNLFEHCPRLRVLTTSWPTGPKPKFFHNPLNHLHFLDKSPTDLVEALRTWPSLKSLELDDIDDPDLEEGTLGTWYNITSLSLRQGGLSPDTVFSLFNFPSLKKLAMVCNGRAAWTSNAFTSFISRSSCMITTFTVRYLVMSDIEFIAVLRVLPALLHLEVRNHFSLHSQTPITSRLFSSLTHQSTSISLVPKLHSLYLECMSPTDLFDDSGFVSMVQSRWFKPGSDLSVEMLAFGRASIRSIVLDVPFQKLDANIYKRLQILNEDGLRVVVSGMNGAMC